MRSTLAFGLVALASLSAAQEQYTIDPSTVQESTRDYWCQQQKSTCPQICLQQPGVKTMNTVENECDSVCILVRSRATESSANVSDRTPCKPPASATTTLPPTSPSTLRPCPSTSASNGVPTVLPTVASATTTALTSAGKFTTSLFNEQKLIKASSDHPCGAQDPFKPNTTATSSSASHSKTSEPSGTNKPSSSSGSQDSDTGFAGQTSTPAAGGAAATLVNFGASYGMAVTLVSVFASFAFL